MQHWYEDCTILQVDSDGSVSIYKDGVLYPVLRNCLQGAVDTITPRTGIVVNGVFIKDE